MAVMSVGVVARVRGGALRARRNAAAGGLSRGVARVAPPGRRMAIGGRGGRGGLQRVNVLHSEGPGEYVGSEDADGGELFASIDEGMVLDTYFFEEEAEVYREGADPVDGSLGAMFDDRVSAEDTAPSSSVTPFTPWDADVQSATGMLVPPEVSLASLADEMPPGLLAESVPVSVSPERLAEVAGAATVLAEDASTSDADGASKKRFHKSYAGELAEVFSIAIPALGVVLADPLMSLIDTACVGQVNAMQLGALGPNTGVFNVVFFMFSFIMVATTGMVSRAMALADRESAGKTLSNALYLAFTIGTVSCLVLEAFPSQALRMMGAAEVLIKPGVEYLRYRALAIPFVLGMTTLQGACMGVQDARTPFSVYVCAGLVNVFADIFLILHCGWGLKGAAIATTGAQILAFFIFAGVMYKRGSNPDPESYSVPVDLSKVPRLSDLRPFIVASGPLLGRQFAIMATYTTFTFFANTLGVMPAAGHQVSMQLWWFLSFFAEPLSVTAQSLVARDSAAAERYSAVRLKVRRSLVLLLTVGCVVGSVVTATNYAIASLLPQLFVQDPSVQALMRSLAVPAAIAQAVCAIVVVFDGMFVGLGDFDTCFKMNAFASATVLSMLSIASNAGQLTLQGLWQLFVLFFVFRLFFQMVFALNPKSGTRISAIIYNLPILPEGNDGELTPLVAAAAA